MQYAKFITTLGVITLLAACGGGGPGTNTPEVDQISDITLNPAAAIQSLYTSNYSGPGIQYSAGTPEIFNGQTYQVQNVLSIDSNGNSSASKRYYTVNPFTIYTPDYSYRTSNIMASYRNYVSRTAGVLPTTAKVGDFGLYETATVTPWTTVWWASTQSTSVWTLTKDTNTTAFFCYGASNSPDLTSKTCYKFNARGELV